MHKLDLVNAFERPLLAFDPVQTTLTALRGNATGPVLPSGAGPACIAVFKTRQEAAKVARPLRAVWPTTLIATSVRRDINVRHLYRSNRTIKGPGGRSGRLVRFRQ